MTKTLEAMKTMLQAAVPAVGGVPTTAQYEQAVKDAVAEFSRLCGLKRTSTLSIVSGTASYSLPADFLKLIEIDSPYDPDHNVVITATGIIPFGPSNPFEEEITIRNGTLTIYPTPQYTMERYIEYKGAWVLTDGSYPLTDDEVQIVLLKAKSIVYEQLGNSAASTGFKYSIGNMSVDKSGVSDGYEKRVSEFDAKFEKACDRYNGAVLLC